VLRMVLRAVPAVLATGKGYHAGEFERDKARLSNPMVHQSVGSILWACNPSSKTEQLLITSVKGILLPIPVAARSTA